MSLDVTLIADRPITKRSTGIFIRRNGATVELTLQEAREQWPERADLIEEHEVETHEVYTANITHNLGEMAAVVSENFYKALWRPEDIGAKQALDLILPITRGVQTLEANSRKFIALQPANGWGTYRQLLDFAKAYENACRTYPTAKVEVDR